MKNLLDFLLKYNHWLLFILLEVISLALLFRFNHYQGSVFFTSANYLSGIVYDAVHEVTGYFHLRTSNDGLVQQNVELQLQLERYRQALADAEVDTGLEQMKQEALADFDFVKAKVINNGLTRTDNYITLDKGEADGVHSEMGMVDGNGVWVLSISRRSIMQSSFPYSIPRAVSAVK